MCTTTTKHIRPEFFYLVYCVLIPSGFNPQISNVADVLSEFNFAALLKQHPQISSKEQQDVKEVQLLRSLFQLDRIPDEEHWQKSTNI